MKCSSVGEKPACVSQRRIRKAGTARENMRSEEPLIGRSGDRIGTAPPRCTGCLNTLPAKMYTLVQEDSSGRHGGSPH